MKLNLILILFLLVTTSLFAQTGNSIKGITGDSTSKVKLPGTTICVLNAKDSIMRKFTYAKENGVFSISGLPSGNFILLVSYPSYADHVEKFTLDAAHPVHDFGSINMGIKNRMLHDVVVKGEVNAIKIKGDTVEFNAKAYVVQPNDKVEDLLKQIPGIQIDKDGKITANGQAVPKVLVDGEEFFGDDPTLVTKNIRADMVDKVQLYDKKSDQAAFTGIDDGVKTKTINIKLKEDKKNGTFGKLDGGAGSRDYYEGQAIYNRFKAKEKYSAYATAANDGKTGLGFTDNNNLGASGNNVQIGDDGGIFIYGGSNDALDSFNGTYDGNGKPIAQSGGVHYDGKWDSDKQSLNTNYKVGAIDVKGLTNTITQQNLQNAVTNNNSNQNFDNYAFRQKLDITWQLKIDTTANLKISADGTFKNFRVNNTYSTVNNDGNGNLLNLNNRAVTNNGDQQMFDASAFYTKKFKKVGRTFSWNVSEAYNDNQTKGYLNSEADFFNPLTGNKDSTRSVNQYKTSDVVSSVLSSNITYSEPLSKTTSVLLNYGLGISNSTADRKSFNPSGPNVYGTLDPDYTNDYKFVQTTNQLGAVFNYKKPKVILNAGLKASTVSFEQTDELTSNILTRNFINWAPQATLQYKPSLQKSFSVNYNGYTTQPTLDQLQPVKVNTDPLNITIGNANLKPSFVSSYNINYNSAKVLSGTSTYFYAYISTRSDAIVNNTTSKAGKDTIQYVNLTNKTPISYSAYLSTSRKIKPIGVNLNIGVNGNGGIGYSYINSVLNKSESYTYSGNVGLSKYIAKKYSFSLNAGPRYTINRFSVQSEANNNAAGFGASAYTAYYLPAQFMISSDARYTYTAKTSTFDAQYITIWNTTFSKSFFKDQSLTLNAIAYDMLNQNRNVYRNVSGSTITQTTNTGIGRYLMFSVVWNFTKFGTEPAKK